MKSTLARDQRQGSVTNPRAQLFPNTHKEHTWGPYSVLAALATLTGLTWFAIMIASLSYTNDYIQVVNGADANRDIYFQRYAGNVLQQYYSFFNLYAFRTICLFASLMVTYNADRHYLSRGAGWTSWIVNSCLFINWFSTDLPFVYSIFNYFSEQPLNAAGQATGPLLSSHRSQFCGSGLASHWCSLNYAHGVLSIIAAVVIFLTWCYACYQLKRARGVSNLLLTWPEVAVINFTVFGLLGYIVWNLSSINLGTTREFTNFTFTDPQNQNALNTFRMFVPSQIWGNYLIHGAWAFSLAATAYISFGGTTAPRMTALIMNWLSFMVLFPAFLYLARHNNENSVGFCSGDRMGFRCPSFDGVAAGMGICMACNFLLGLTMMAVLKQVETADFAVDMYGDKALAVDAVKSTGSVPIADPHYASSTRESTPELANRTLGRDVELGRGAPIVA